MAGAIATRDAADESEPLSGIHLELAVRSAAGALDVHLEIGQDVPASSLSSASAIAITDLVVTDESGALPLHREGERWSFGRSREGLIDVRYRVPPDPAPFDDARAVAIDPGRARLPLRAALLLPEGSHDALPVRIDVRADMEGETIVASNLGTGSRLSRTMTIEALARSMVLVSPSLGTASFRAREGIDDAAWTGYTAFDPRIVAAEVAGFRTAVRDALEDDQLTPMTLLTVADTRPSGQYEVQRLPLGVVAFVGSGEAYAAPLRTAVLSAVMNEWVGQAVWLPPKRAPGDAWWSGGIARYMAVRFAFDFGLISPDERRDELEQLVSIAWLASQEELSSASVQVARSALYGFAVDRALRSASGGEHTLASVMAQLLEQARRGDESSEEDYLAAIGQVVGRSSADSAFDALFAGDHPALPPSPLGDCYRRVERTYEAFDLGMEVRTDGGVRTVEKVDADGPAARAGLRSGDVLSALTYRDGRPEVEVVATVTAGDRARDVRYRPVGRSVRGPGFERLEGRPDAACRDVQ